MTKKKAPDAPEQILVLKISLQHIEPEIWRRIEVPADCTLGDLHMVAQVVMGWTDSHLHSFQTGRGVAYASYEMDEPLEDTQDEDAVTIGEVLNRGRKSIIYHYDFGDGWEHVIRREKAIAPEPGVKYPRCLGGERACPPEDCGGIYGYTELLEVLAKAEDTLTEEDKDLLDWVGEYDPKAFDLEETNSILAELS